MWGQFEALVCRVSEYSSGSSYRGWSIWDYYCTDGELNWIGYIGLPTFILIIAFAINEI